MNTNNVGIFNFFNPKVQLKDSESTIKNKLLNLFSKLRGVKFITTSVLEFKKIENDDETKYTTFYFNSKAETIFNESDIDDIFESFYTMIISNIPKYLGKGSGWIIDSVVDHIINVSKYNLLASSSYIKLPTELNHQYLHSADHPARIRKIDKLFGDELDFEDIKFPVKIKDIHRIEKNSIGISVSGYERKEKYLLNVLRNTF